MRASLFHPNDLSQSKFVSRVNAILKCKPHCLERYQTCKQNWILMPDKIPYFGHCKFKAVYLSRYQKIKSAGNPACMGGENAKSSMDVEELLCD